MNNYNRLTSWHIDSLRIKFDSFLFSGVNVDRYLLINEKTGEVVDNFKEKALKLNYLNDSIYIYRTQRELKKQIYDNVYVYFSSKVLGPKYLKGISATDIYKALHFLLDEKVLIFNFNRIQKIIESAHFIDVDYCQDYIFKNDNKTYETLRKQFKYLSDLYRPSKKMNCGIQNFYTPKQYTQKDANQRKLGLSVNHRQTASINRPFFKVYNKTLDMHRDKNINLFQMLPAGTRRTLTENLVLRVEITLKNKEHFNKYDLDNNIKKLFISDITGDYILNDFYHLNFFKQHTIDENNKETILKGLKPKDKATLNIINYIYTNNKDLTEIEFKHIITRLIIGDYEGSEATRQSAYAEKILSAFYSHIIKFDIKKQDILESENIFKTLFKLEK